MCETLPGHILHVMTFISFLFIVTLNADCTSTWYLSINKCLILRALKAGTCSLVSKYVKSRAVIVYLWLKIALESSNYIYGSFMLILITEERIWRNHLGRMSLTKLLNWSKGKEELISSAEYIQAAEITHSQRFRTFNEYQYSWKQ